MMKKGKTSACSSRPRIAEDNEKKAALRNSTCAKGASNDEQDSGEKQNPIWESRRTLSKGRGSRNRLKVETNRSDIREDKGKSNTTKRADSFTDDAGNQSSRRSTRVSDFTLKIKTPPNNQIKVPPKTPKETERKSRQKKNEETIANQTTSNATMTSAKKRKRTADETNDQTRADSQRDSAVGVKVEQSVEKTFSCAIPDNGKLIGAHCSIAGGLSNAVKEAVSLGGHAIGLFLKSQRSWNAKPMDSATVDKFKAACKEHGFSPNSILPHGSYLLNCGSPNPDTWKKSREGLLDELQRCEALGLTLFNFHPGSTCGAVTVDECLDKIADCINWAHAETKFVITVIENMSCQGNTVGGRFEELRGIIDRVKDKLRVGICLDTCHAFAAGFDLATEEGYRKFVSDFDSIVGFQYLKAMHLNDSKGAVGCHLDRHENIGKGFIGLDGFRRLMSDPHFDGIPMILETPSGAYEKEIKTLYKMTE